MFLAIRIFSILIFILINSLWAFEYMKNNNINFNAGNFFTCLQTICFTSIKRGLLKPLAYFFGFKFVREIIHKSTEAVLQPSDRNGVLKRIGN
jgi:hypothetical protein